MPVLISPLQLEGYYVQELHVAVRQDPESPRPLFFQLGLHPQLEGLYNPDDLTINTQIQGAANKEDPNRLVSIVQIETRTEDGAKFPYDFRVVLAGYFRLTAEVPAEDRANAIHALRTTAASVLYSAARELIASVTGRGPYPAAILPTIVIQLDPATEPEQPQEQPKAAKKPKKKGKAKDVRNKKQQR
jgi:preprotein translocase subunit SecB